jgi:hypothetical protein
MAEQTLHRKLRTWLIDFGKEKGYEAWTTDLGNNVEFSKVQDIKVDYRPDVVWRHKRTKDKVYFEIALEEDHRAIIGEVFLASQVEGYAKIYIIRLTQKKQKYENIEHFLQLAFREDGVLKDYKGWRPRVLTFDLDTSEEDIKKRIIETLTEESWIKEVKA